MKTKLHSLLLVAALGAMSPLSAQVTLEDFSSFLSPSTLFFGDWSSTGDQFAGNATPSAGFTQDPTHNFFSFSGGTNDATAAVERSFVGPLNLTGNILLTVAARRLDTNTADSFTVFLLDGTGVNTAAATFQLNDFTTGPGFTTNTLELTFGAGFSFDAVSAFRIAGNDPFGSGNLGVAFDSLVVSAPRTSVAVPEPSTYTACAAAALGVLAAVRSLRRRRAV